MALFVVDMLACGDCCGRATLVPIPGVSIWSPVQSSWVEAIAHWIGPDGLPWLGLRTKDNHEYHYRNIPRFIYQQLRDSPSKGQGLWRLVFKRTKGIKIR